MDFKSISNSIKEVWHSNDLDNKILDLKKCSEGAATGSEAIFLTGRFLIDLEKTDKNAFEMVKEHINNYIILCNASGLFYNR